MTKIDFVLPWVDGSDLAWQKDKNQYGNTTKSEYNCSSSFRDMNTLKYVLRSIEKNCPWYNKIHLITCGHSPEWLDVNHPKINLVTHEELYFDNTHLPVFSSSSIEMNLPNLRGVSEQFVYLNDDTIIFNKVGIERFFQDGLPVDFLSHGWLPRNKIFGKLRGMDVWVHSLNNNLQLINKQFAPLKLKKETLYQPSYRLKTKLSNFLLQNIYKRFIWLEHWHHPTPYLKSTLKDVYQEFGGEMMTCSSNRFRASNDLTQYLYRYWQLASESFFPYKHDDAFDADIVSFKYLKTVLNKIERNKNINFICFNDQMLKVSDKEFNRSKELLNSYLEKVLPIKASFEKDNK